jgi:hexosaminidase
MFFSFEVQSYQVDNRWYCKNQNDCLPWREEMNQRVDRIFESQNLCRLMCGKFASLWPLPTVKCELQKSTIDINPNSIRFEYPDNNEEATRDFYDQISFLFLKNLNDECGKMCNKPSENEMFIRLIVSNPSLALNSETNEAYQLNLTTAENHIFAQISAQTIFGIRHGLETLSQLMTKVLDDNYRAGIVMISNAFISDKPAYQHRGLLIDSARHFIPTSTILKILDGMAINKMNVFHWHITDSQSFPMETKRLPKMYLTGAFSGEI